MNKKINIYSIPNFITLFNLFSGILSLWLSVSGHLYWAAAFILIGAIFDFLDGLVARIIKQSSEIGKQLDSLADMITFGLAPSTMIFIFWLGINSNPSTQPSFLNPVDFSIAFDQTMNGGITNFFQRSNWTLLSFLIAGFSALRLAKFNVDDRQSEDFIGLPTPANSLFFASLIVGTQLGVFSQELVSMDFIWIILIITFSLLLVSEIPMFSLKFKSLHWKNNESRWILLVLALIIIPIVKEGSIAIIVFLYLIMSFFTRISFKKLKNEI